eukprot:289091-Amphidinium_carterae.1
MDKSAPKQWGAGHQAPCTRCSIGRRIGSGHRPPMVTMKAVSSMCWRHGSLQPLSYADGMTWLQSPMRLVMQFGQGNRSNLLSSWRSPSYWQ